MATEKSFQLYINKDNVKHYFTASGGVLNGAQISTKYITMRTSSTTATFTMNDAGRDVLFPSAAAIAHKVDVWAQAIATLNSSENTINVAIAGQNAITTERIHTSLTEYTGSVSGSFTKSNTSAVYVIKILNVFHAAGVRDTSITAYFTQYSCTANKSGNGVKNVSVSNAEPYAGETVTFSAELYNGANFDGWYSDEACTQLVSSNLTYSTTAADLTLYAKAIIDADIYNCSAVAGENIASASVSDDSVVSGDSVTFTAQLNEHCTFDGWFSDSNYTTLVSTANPYTAIITSDTTLYAKGTKISYSISVGTAEHGIATVSANTAHYGDSVTFTFTPEDETWELYGWYSDEGLTQLVSESNPYTHSVTGNVMLYPKVGIKRYTATIKMHKNPASATITVKIVALQYDQLTKLERRQLKIGNFEQIDQSKIIAIDSDSGAPITREISASVKVPINSTIAIWANWDNQSPKDVVYIADKNYIWISNYVSNLVSPYNYYTFVLQKDEEYRVGDTNIPCYCSAVAMDGIEYASVITPTVQGYNALFEADLINGYEFAGWYSDEACTQLISTDNPAQVKTPSTGELGTETSLTLYAKATPISSTTGIYLKRNGSWIKAKSVFKKTNGAWVEQEDLSAIFSGESSGTASNYVYGGSV